MKKLVGVILILMVVMTNVAAFAANQLPTTQEAYDMIMDYTETYYENYYNSEIDDSGFACYCGLLSAEAFESETGLECTIDNWRKWSIDYWKMTSLTVLSIDSINGNEIYLAIGESDEEELTYGHKKAKVIFMISK